LRLSRSECEELSAAVAAMSKQVRFTQSHNFDESISYLPRRVLNDDPSWLPLLLHADSTKHFRDHGGRSFVRVYLKAPGMGVSELRRLREQLYDRYGEAITVTSGTPALPPGSETLLVRSFGIFRDDGSYADSGLLEEVVMRIFKHGEQTYDVATSDWRGTLIYQYKARRRLVLDHQETLGLERIPSDASQFIGFFGDVPDAANAGARTLTTMKFNCIACHSELLYGASSVFSFAMKEDAEPSVEHGPVPRLEPWTGSPGFRLRTPAADVLHKRVGAAASPGGTQDRD
jgi:hypothetical protein